MGRSKRRYNAKARQVVKTNIDNSKTNEIKLEFKTNDYGSTDTSNPLVLPSSKRKTNVISDRKEKIKFLSKAHRKRLEKIVDKKKKKENRAALLESLSKVQATPEEMQHLTTISSVQTLGLRKLNEYKSEERVQDNPKQKIIKINSIKGAYKRSRLLGMDKPDDAKKMKYNPNIVGLKNSSDYDTDTDSNDEIHVEKNDLSPAKESNKIENESKDKNENEVIVISEENNNTENEIKHDNVNDSKKTKKITYDNDKVSKDIKPTLDCPKTRVEVKRDPKIQVERLKLPILAEEQRIMEIINENEIVIVAGETGCGKTTQIPQFLYEAGYTESKMIAVTEPRRVATVAMSKRVARELGLTCKEVSYLMRFEGNVTKDTKIKFMTDGVLLKEIQTDYSLSKYSVVIIDEAHERSVHTDILLAWLSRIVPMRKKKGNPLRLIIMSATLRVEDFTENTRLFKTPPPMVKVETRQFPVTIHFNKTTHTDYLKDAYKKTVQIHTRLPEGGILIFVTGQQEVNYLVRKLKAAFPYRKDVHYSKLITKNVNNEANTALDSEPEDIESDDDEVEKEMKRLLKARRKRKQKSKTLPKINLDDYDMPEDDGQADLMGDGDSDGYLSDSDSEDVLLPEIKACRQPLWVLPLYSMLGSAQQALVFKRVPVGARLCVVSTDVAETSLTIPAIKYVVDTGKKKMRVYDHSTGASAYRVVWTSQASAEQRAGRAGRTRAGHAYRLYSSAVFQHDCPPQHAPDLCRRPIDDIVLMMKCLGIDKVHNFPFPTAPDRMQLRFAEQRLETLGILEKYESKKIRKPGEEILKVTRLGIAVSAYPVLPRYGKMLALSDQFNLLPYTIAIVSALTVREVMSGNADGWPATGHTLLLGDPGVLLRVVGATDYAIVKGEEEEQFCAKNGINEKSIKEIRKLRKQLTSEINLSIPGVKVTVDPEMQPPDEGQARQLRQILLCGLGDQVGRKIGLHEVKQGEDKRRFKYAYYCSNIDEPVFLHSESILRQTIPEWVVYEELYETGPEHKKRMVMRNVTAIEPEWLPLYVPNLCKLGNPLEDPAPRYDDESGQVKCHFKGTFGKSCWELPVAEINYPESFEKYRWFAKFFLEGKVFRKLTKYVKSMIVPPSTMIKSWAKLQARTESMLKALTARRVGTKGELEEAWKEQPKYLLYEYLQWVPVSAHNDVTLSWPPL